MPVKEHSFYERVGKITELLAASNYHAKANIFNYLPSQILVTLVKNQIGLYLDQDGGMKAMITWAYITEEVEVAICESGRSIRFNEWPSGHRLFINDFVCPYGNTREIINDARERFFQKFSNATSVRRYEDGTVRKVNLWK